MNVSVSTTLAPFSFPAGTVLGQMRFRLLNAGGTAAAQVFADVPLAGPVVFSGVAAGSYTLNIQRMTNTLQPVGPVVEQPVTVAAPAPVVGDVPASATVTVS